MVGHRSFGDYSPADRARVLDTCRVVATWLGESSEHVTIVGGIVPTLLTRDLSELDERHVGTSDLDLALTLAADPDVYLAVAAQLERAGFVRATTLSGGEHEHRWTHPDAHHRAHIDVIPVKDDAGGVSGRLSELRFAFAGRKRISIGAGLALWVCGPGPFVLLKTAAFRDRNEPKDVYDLCFILRHCRTDELVQGLAPLMHDPLAQSLMDELGELFADEDAPGPQGVAAFLGVDDDETLTDAVGLVLDLCSRFFI